VTGGNGGLGRRTAMHHFGQKGPGSMMPPASMSSTSLIAWRRSLGRRSGNLYPFD
jgi:hypothetical protein